MRKIIVASDKFKGTVSSTQIAEISRRVIGELLPGCQVVTIPVADGGEGTVDCFVNAAGAQRKTITVSGPLGDDTDATYAIMGETAVIEMSAAAGLFLISERKDPLRATTYGVGQLISDALDSGCSTILLGLGGSATTDGGCGMACALGARFLDSSGSSFVPTGGSLADICEIDLSSADERIAETRFIAMCDVNNPLFGENGAAYIYGPQKGADTGTVALLDKGLRHLAEVSHRYGSPDAETVPGSGAAGGMGFGTLFFLNGALRSGAETILDIIGFDEHMEDADLVITGEGKLDSQSLSGKLLSAVADRTKAAGKPLIAIVGTIDDSACALYAQGLDAVFQTNRAGLPFEQLKERAVSDYEATMRDVVSLIRLAGSVK